MSGRRMPGYVGVRPVAAGRAPSPTWQNMHAPLRMPFPATNLGESDAGRDRDVEGAYPARLRDVCHGVDRGQQGGRAAVVLAADGEADVAVQGCLREGEGAGGELEGDHAVPGRGGRLD